VSLYNPRLLRCDTPAAVRAALAAVGADPEGVGAMAPKGSLLLLRLDGVSAAAAHVIKEHMLSWGADAALSSGAYRGQEATTDVLLLGSERAVRSTLDALAREALPDLPRIASEARVAVDRALGDLPAPTLPSGLLTPALRVQEKLGWRLGIEAYTFHKYTLFETIEKTAKLGLPYVGGLSFQKVSKDIPKNFTPNLSDDELQAIRLKMDEAGVRMLTYYYHTIPNDEAGCRAVFEFGRKMGIEVFMTEPAVEALPMIDRFCQEYGIKVGLHNHDRKASPHYWSPEAILRVCEGRSSYMGACADVGYWIRDGIDPVKGIEQLKDRLITLQLHDLDVAGPKGADVPWGSGAGQTEALLRKMHELQVKPVMVGLEYSRDWLENEPPVQRCIEFFNQLSLSLSK